MTLELLEEDEGRMEQVHTIETISLLEPGDLERLTEKRLRLLDTLPDSEEPLNRTALSDAIAWDPKNVSEDLQRLEDLGLITRRRRGREKLAQPQGHRVHILLESGSACNNVPGKA